MTGPLGGIRIIEVSSFVAAPLCGMTLAQLGADVTRVDPIGGGADYRRWPLADGATSIYWTGLNKGKRSAAVNLRSPDGQKLVQRLVTESDGIVVTNAANMSWLNYETLSALRPDVIHVQLTGKSDGGTGVDYTVNATAGFPLVTGPKTHSGPINHVLPAWDVSCGLYAALAVVTAVRHREITGAGTNITIALEDVALATAGNLGLLTEPQVSGTERPRLGNAIFGQYGQDFTSADGVSFMVVMLTRRHFRDMVTISGTGQPVSALAEALGADFNDEGTRYRYRDVLSGLFSTWFAEHTAEEIASTLAKSTILWERYRSFAEVAKHEKVTANPMFTTLVQEGVGEYLAPGLPIAIGGVHPEGTAAPALGADTVALFAELGLDSEEIDRLTATGAIAGEELR